MPLIVHVAILDFSEIDPSDIMLSIIVYYLPDVANLENKHYKTIRSYVMFFCFVDCKMMQ